MIRKCIQVQSHPWGELPSFPTVFPTADALFDRCEKMWLTASNLGFGPKIFNIERRRGRMYIIMEFLPESLDSQWVRDHDQEIQQFIRGIHTAGYCHGDLHADNLRRDHEGKLRVIDIDTMFAMTEIGTYPIVAEWAKIGFDMDDPMELISWEQEGNYRASTTDAASTASADVSTASADASTASAAILPTGAAPTALPTAGAAVDAHYMRLNLTRFTEQCLSLGLRAEVIAEIIREATVE